VGDGKVVPRATAALAKAKTIPPLQYVHDIGPIPGKEWEICGPPYDNRRARAL